MEWIESDARLVLESMPMNQDEPISAYQLAKERQKWWDRLKKDFKEKVYNLPNFDREIFLEITGIDVGEREEHGT